MNNKKQYDRARIALDKARLYTSKHNKRILAICGINADYTPGNIIDICNQSQGDSMNTTDINIFLGAYYE